MHCESGPFGMNKLHQMNFSIKVQLEMKSFFMASRLRAYYSTAQEHGGSARRLLIRTMQQIKSDTMALHSWPRMSSCTNKQSKNQACSCTAEEQKVKIIGQDVNSLLGRENEWISRAGHCQILENTLGRERDFVWIRRIIPITARECFD